MKIEGITDTKSIVHESDQSFKGCERFTSVRDTNGDKKTSKKRPKVGFGFVFRGRTIQSA